MHFSEAHIFLENKSDSEMIVSVRYGILVDLYDALIIHVYTI